VFRVLPKCKLFAKKIPLLLLNSKHEKKTWEFHLYFLPVAEVTSGFFLQIVCISVRHETAQTHAGPFNSVFFCKIAKYGKFYTVFPE
jgi:hypothetical protein